MQKTECTTAIKVRDDLSVQYGSVRMSAYMGVFTDVSQQLQSVWSAFPADPCGLTDEKM